MDSFKAGYGTVLFFEDEAIVKSLQEQFALYADNFPIWSNQASGMHQLVVWTALEAEGLGASLQHYNPLIDDEVKKEWNIPENWKLIAQMPFGNPTASPGEKEFQPLEDRVKFYIFEFEANEKEFTLDNQQVFSTIYSKKESVYLHIVGNPILFLFKWTFSVSSKV